MSGMHRDRMNAGRQNDTDGQGTGRKDASRQSRGFRRISFQRVVQILSAALVNGYVVGFQKGTIFTGKSKAICVSVLNCYSCPGALGACPIGSLQEALGGRHHFPPILPLPLPAGSILFRF